MENFGVAKGDIFKSFPKEIPQLSIINYPLSIRASAREMAIWRVISQMDLFSFFLHDEYECKFRKMLTIEQFSNEELAQIFSHQYIDEPLKYQTGLFQMILMQGQMKKEEEHIMALQFYSPIYLLLTLCDREPQREKEALQLLEKHIRQFNRMYKG